MRPISRVLCPFAVAAILGICLAARPHAQEATCELRYVEKYPITRVFPYYPGATGTERRVVDLLFEPLARKTTGGTCASDILDLQGATANADGTVWTFPLKSIKWHSGRALTSTDVERTFEELRRLEQNTQSAWSQELVYFRHIARMQAAGQSLAVHYKRPMTAEDACFTLEYFYVLPWDDLPRLTSLYHGHLNEYVPDATELTESLTGNGRWMRPAGLGMISDAYEIALVAYPDYSTGESPIQEVHGRFQPIPGERARYFTQGEVNVIIEVPPSLRSDVRNVPGAQEIIHERNSFTLVNISKRNPALADRRVREALILAVNRAEILEAQYGGSGDIIEAPYPPETICWNPNVLPRKYDPPRAVELLREAGFKGSPESGWSRDDCGPLSNLEFLLEHSLSGDEDQVVVNSIVNDLNRVGIVVRVRSEEPAQVARKLRNGEYDFHLRTIQVSRAWNVARALSDEYPENPENKHLMCSSPRVKELFRQYQDVLDDPIRMADLGQMLHEEIYRACDHIYLWSLKSYGIYRSDDVIFTVCGTTLFEAPGVWGCR